jgi:hypothetical protein
MLQRSVKTAAQQGKRTYELLDVENTSHFYDSVTATNVANAHQASVVVRQLSLTNRV